MCGKNVFHSPRKYIIGSNFILQRSFIVQRVTNVTNVTQVKPKQRRSAVNKILGIFEKTGSVIKKKHQRNSWPETDEINLLTAFTNCHATSSQCLQCLYSLNRFK